MGHCGEAVSPRLSDYQSGTARIHQKAAMAGVYSPEDPGALQTSLGVGVMSEVWSPRTGYVDRNAVHSSPLFCPHTGLVEVPGTLELVGGPDCPYKYEEGLDSAVGPHSS